MKYRAVFEIDLAGFDPPSDDDFRAALQESCGCISTDVYDFTPQGMQGQIVAGPAVRVLEVARADHD